MSARISFSEKLADPMTTDVGFPPPGDVLVLVEPELPQAASLTSMAAEARAAKVRRMGGFLSSGDAGPGSDTRRYDEALGDQEGGLGHDGEGGDHDGARAQLGVVARRLPVDDVAPEASEPHEGSDRGGRHDLQRGRAQAEDDEGQGHRHLDRPEHLVGPQTHAARRVDEAAVHALDAHVRVDEDRGQGQEHQRDHGRLQPDAEEEREDDEQPEGGQRPTGVAEHGDEGCAPARVTGVQAQRQADRRRDEQGLDGVPEVLGKADEEPAAAAPVGAVEQIGEAASERLVHGENQRPLLAHGASRRPPSRSSPSHTSAQKATTTTPRMISVRKLLSSPVVKRVPRPPMPTRAPTVDRLMLETVATRRPPMITGTAAGSSTVSNRRSGRYPMAAADVRTSSGTDPRPSMTLRTRMARL